MPRRPSKIAALYEAIPAPMSPPAECAGLMCLNMECQRCWGILDDLDAIFDPTPGVMVDLDEATYTALGDVARRQGTTMATVAQVVLRKWAARQA
jgi:hypothetical protein